MTAPPVTASGGERRPLGCLAKGLIALGGFVVVAVVAAAISMFLSRQAFAEVRPEAVRIANEFAACSLASDRACIQRLSKWDEATLEKAARFATAVNSRLGKRGPSTLDEKSVRFYRHAAVGKDSLRWRIQLSLRVAYEKDAKASETFVLEDRGQGLKVMRINWNSDELLKL